MSKYDNFEYPDEIMQKKGYEAVLSVLSEWEYTKGDVPSLVNFGASSTFHFNLCSDNGSSSPLCSQIIALQSKYDANVDTSPFIKNVFLSENLAETAFQTKCFLENSSFFKFKDKELNLLQQLIEQCKTSSDETVFFESKIKTNDKGGGKIYYMLAKFIDEQRDVLKTAFINFVTHFKIKLYKNTDTDDYVFVWLLTNKRYNKHDFCMDAFTDRDFCKGNYDPTIAIKAGKKETGVKTIYEIIHKLESGEGYAGLRNINRNLIVFGPPGTGKSYSLDQFCSCVYRIFVTTFHPDYDYSDFIGQYRPTSILCNDSTDTNTECSSKVVYQFTPGIFTKALKEALENPMDEVILRIEEINRGNTASIFGDLFQLLDRNHDGNSIYGINTSKEIMNYLGLTEDTKMYLPSNLYILASMNTSDQSLFPMDSAFKRRWEWRYIPIDYEDAKNLCIKIGDNCYCWSDFIKSVNKKIIDITDSEDKQLGNRFVNPADGIINLETFAGKVLFYLWNDIFKHEDHQDEENIFKVLAESDKGKIRFSALYDTKGNPIGDMVIKLLKESLDMDPVLCDACCSNSLSTSSNTGADTETRSDSSVDDTAEQSLSDNQVEQQNTLFPPEESSQA